MKALRLLTALLLALTGAVQAQVVTTSPAFFTAADPVTLTFDASQGNAGLNNFTGDVYAHIGVITNLSTSPTDWKYVKFTNFNAPSPTVQLTRTGTNTYTLAITPNVRAWFNVPAAEQILKLAMVFRNATGTQVGRATGGGDIFVDVAQSANLAVRITAPAPGANPLFVNSGTSISVTGTASQAATLTLRLNGTQVSQQTNATSFSGSVTPTQAGRNVIRLTATSGSTSVSDSVIAYIRPTVNTAALPSGMRDGINYLAGGTSAVLVLTAPNKQFVYAIGEFNNWQPDQAAYMNKTPDGNQWWVQLNGLTAGREYAFQYLVDGTLRIADPYAEKILDPSNDQYIPAVTYPNLKAYPTGQTSGIVSVLQTNAPAYTWTTTNYQRPAKSKLVIYELHLRDFIARHDYQTLIDTLGYLSRLGVNAIELMPVNEFEGNDSWGYNPSFHMAPDKYYGPKNELKRFVDQAHRRGIAVILDVVLNHAFGQNPLVQLYFANGNVTSDSPWFNVTPTHPFNVGYDFNHESPFTKAYSKRVMQYWLSEYRVDGYRFDLSKGFTQTNNPTNVGAWGQYDQSRINIWTDYNNYIRTVDQNAYVILEHFADNSEEVVLSNAGMMLWGNMNYNYNEATMGYTSTSNLSGGYYGSTAQGGRGWTQPGLVTYMESHDEERLMFKNITYGNQGNPAYNVRSLPVALARQEAAAAFFFTVPGPKMIWQFGEVGYDVSIDFNGRTGSKPIYWNYYQDANRRRLYETYRALIALKKTQPVFDNPTTYTQQVTGAAKSIHLSDATQKVTVIGNFDVLATPIDPAFQQTGKWYDYLSGDSINVSSVNATINLQPGEYHVYTTQRLRRAVLLPTKAEQQIVALGLTVAPNPAATRATVRLTLPSTAPVTVSVRNVIGSEVRRVQLPARAAGSTVEVPLNIEGLAAGMYLVNVQAGSTAATTRLVVQ